jgi:hypothetical protein
MLWTVLAALPAGAASRLTQRPQLLVNIVVEGLSADYLDLLYNQFGEHGLKRLLDGGVVIDHVEFGPGVDATGAIAMLCTGASPSVNGVATAEIYDTQRHVAYSVLTDPEKIGNYTNETLSPKALRTSTLSDELRIDGDGTGFVHTIAQEAAQAIILSGHAGNSAFWISDTDGKWATTTHYRDVPAAISNRNFTQPLSLRLDTMTWRPLLAMDKYPALPEHKRHYPFHHTFDRNSPDRYRLFKRSAPCNTEVTTVATEYIRTMRLGARDAMDMLNVVYTVAPYPGSDDPLARAETLDAYIRLDREIERLMKSIDATTTAGKVVVMLNGVPTTRTCAAPDDEKWGVPGGEFSTRRAQSLLNMYLIARNGNGQWVTDVDGNRFYLNHTLIEQNKLEAEELRSDAAKFLTRMAGVADAYTIDDIQECRAGSDPLTLRRNTVVSQGADLYVNVLPGWTLSNDANVNHTTRTTVRAVATGAPTIIYAPERLTAQRVSTAIDARQIAPTVAHILRIRSPNGADNPIIYTIFAPEKQ